MDFSKILWWIITGAFIVAFIVREICLLPSSQEVESWILVTNQNKNTVFTCEKNITKIAYDESIVSIDKQPKDKLKNLRAIEFYATNLEIHDSAFLGCKKLKEVTFYSTPKSIAKNAFKGCNDLSLIKLIGNQEDFKGFSITVPKNCKIQFVPLKQVEVFGEEKSPVIQADVYLHGTESDKMGITQNITNTNNTTNNNTHIETDIDNSKHQDIDIKFEATEK